jgi:hypothetical protein
MGQIPLLLLAFVLKQSSSSPSPFATIKVFVVKLFVAVVADNLMGKRFSDIFLEIETFFGRN